MAEAIDGRTGGAGKLRRGLMLYGSTAALAAALMLAEGGVGPALAQDIGPRVTPNFAAQGDFSVPGPTPAPSFDYRSGSLDIVSMNRDAVLNWTTYDTAPPGGAQGNSYVNFLPAGTELRFVGNGQSFTAINRVFTTPDNAGAYRGIAFEGQVTSYLYGDGPNSVGPVGGNIWFYSPGGILATGSARFNVGSLLLSASDLANFSERGDNRSVEFTGVANAFASVILQAGARITLAQPGSSFAIVAPTIEQGGEVTVDGSVLYLSAEQGQLFFYNSGEISASTYREAQAGNEIRHLGTTTGPASTGTDDLSIYDPQTIEFRTGRDVRVLLSGSIGFAGASDASLGPNGAIVLSGGQVTAQGNLTLGGETTIVAASVELSAGAGETIRMGGDANGSYGLTASTADGKLTSTNGGLIDIAGDVTFTSPRDRAAYSATADGGRIAVGGDLTLDASVGIDGYGGSLGGSAEAAIRNGGAIDVGGEMALSADATAVEDDNGVTFARGGIASLVMSGADSTLTVGGGLILSAEARPFFGLCECSPPNSGSAVGGYAGIDVSEGTLSAASAIVRAGAEAYTNPNRYTVGNPLDAEGGTAQIMLGNSVVTFGSVTALADATAAGGARGEAGGTALGGTALFYKGAGGSLAMQGIVVSAEATGGAGSGTDGETYSASRGGDARGGSASIELAQNAEGLGYLDLSARARAGDGGSPVEYSAESGGDGGDALGGSASLTLSGADTNLAGVIEGSLNVSASGGAGGDGEADTLNALQAGDGGAGGSARGGSLSITAANGAEFSWSGSFDLSSFGGVGGNGGNQTVGETGPSTIGQGGRGGDAMGAAIAITADGGLISGDLAVDAGGEAGQGGAHGFDRNGASTGAAAYGVASGGSIGLTALDNGVSRFDIGTAYFDAGADVAGHIAIADESTDPGASMRFGTLIAQAYGAPADATPAIRLSAVRNAVVVDGTANLSANSVALSFTGSGRLKAGNALLNSSDGDIAITHANNPGVLSLDSSGLLEIYAVGNYAAGAGSVVATGQLAAIRATGSLTAPDTRGLGGVLLSAGGDASVGNVTSGASFELFAGALGEYAGYAYRPDARATITGTVTARASVLVASGGFAEFASGSLVRSGVNITVRTGDDIVVASGASLVSGIDPQNYGPIRLLAGDINFGQNDGDLVEPIGTPIASLLIGGSLDTSGTALYLSGDAIDGSGSSIATGYLTVDVTDAPLSGPFSSDGGLLSDGCRQGSACLGSIVATGDVAIGLASNNGLVSLRTGTIDFTGAAFDAVTLQRLDLNPGNVPGSLVARERISLRSVNTAVALAGLTLEAPTLRLQAGTDLAAGSATLNSPNTIEINVGADIAVGTILAGGGLDDGSESSTFVAFGDFIVGSLTYGGATDMRISALGDLSLGTADPGGGTIDLKSSGALVLGSTADTSGAIRLAGASVAFDNLASSGLVHVSAGDGGIGGSLGMINTAGGILLESTGNVVTGDLVADADIEIAAATVQATSLLAGGALSVSAGGAGSVGSFSSGGDAVFVGSSFAIGGGSAGGSLSVEATGGDLTFGTLQSAGFGDLRASGAISGGDVISAGALSLFGGSLAISGAEGAAGVFASIGGNARFTTLSSSSGPVTVAAGGDITGTIIAAATDARLSGKLVGVSNVSAGANLVIDAIGLRATTLSAGKDVTLALESGIFIGTATAGGNLSAEAGDGDLAFVAVTAAGNAALSAAGALAGGDATAGGTLTLAGANLAIGTGAGAAGVNAKTPGTASFTALASSGGAISLDSGGAVTGGNAQAAGPVSLAGASVALTSASFGNGLSLTARTGELTGTGLYQGTGAANLLAAQGIAIGSIAVNGGGAVSLTAANTIAIANSLATGGALSLTAGGLVSLNGSATGQTIALTAADLAIGAAGSLGSAITQRISLASSAPVTLGAGAGGGFAVDAAEFARIHSTGDLLIAALAGNTPGAGSLTVGSLTITAGSGGQIGAAGAFGLTASGVLDVGSPLSIAGAGSGTTLMLTGDAVDLDYATAALAVLDSANAPTGRIGVNGRLITSLSASAAADIAGKTPAEIDRRLGLADVVREIGLFRTANLSLEGRDAILIQNSGGATFDARRGVNVGALTVTGASDGRTLVVINGIVNNATGVNAARIVTVTTPIAGGSSVNGCVLANIAGCVVKSEPPGSILFGTGDLIKKEREDDEAEDGVADGKTVPPPIDTSRIDDPAGLPMIDDPVTGAGNEDLWQPPEG